MFRIIFVPFTLACCVLRGSFRYAEISFQNSKWYSTTFACSPTAVLYDDLFFSCQVSSDYLLGALQVWLESLPLVVMKWIIVATVCVHPQGTTLWSFKEGKNAGENTGDHAEAYTDWLFSICVFLIHCPAVRCSGLFTCVALKCAPFFTFFVNQNDSITFHQQWSNKVGKINTFVKELFFFMPRYNGSVVSHVNAIWMCTRYIRLRKHLFFLQENNLTE